MSTPVPSPLALGAAMCAVREHLGVSQLAITSRVGRTDKWLSAFENGRRIPVANAWTAWFDAIEAAKASAADRTGRSTAWLAEFEARLHAARMLYDQVRVEPKAHNAEGVVTISHQQLNNLSSITSPPIITGLSDILYAYIHADAIMGPLFLINGIRSQIPIIERLCDVTRGADRIKALDFGSVFMEFCGWLHQDAGDPVCAIRWTNKALDYAMELGDQRVIAYILMRKSNIETDAGNPSRGFGLANAALTIPDALTPRLKAVILRQRANCHALLGEPDQFATDAEHALDEAIAGLDQSEDDRAAYCTPAYVEMEIGASWILIGNPTAALGVLEQSLSRWSDPTQARDRALCLSRLAAAYAAAGAPEQACETGDDAINLAHGLGSQRVITQLKGLRNRLTKWSQQVGVADLLRRLDTLIESFRPASVPAEGVP